MANSTLAEQLALLSDSDPSIRADAADRLMQRVRTGAESREQLAAEIQQRLLERSTSIEARLLLQQLFKELPIVPPPAELRVTPREIQSLIQELDSPVYSDRLAPQAKLFWLASSVQPACVLISELKQQFARTDLAAARRQQFDLLWGHARWTWLSSDQTKWELPPISVAELDAWLDVLVRPAKDVAAEQRRRDAERDLIDAIVRDDTRERATARIDARLKDTVDEAAIAALRELRDWIDRPTIVAEIWRQGVHTGVQHLFVGVPQFPEGGVTSTFFDWANERQAHLASGNVLRPDTYEVGVAFLPPPGSRVERWPGSSLYYHLVYQPTPQRRLQYRYELERSQSVRYLEISERTINQLAQRTERGQYQLASSEAALLVELHPQVVSRFLGEQIVARWLPRLLAADSPLAVQPADEPSRPTDKAQQPEAPPPPAESAEQVQEWIETACAVLLQNGAAPALAPLERTGEAAVPLAIRDAAWASALAIVQRDDCPEAEYWLDRWIDRETTLGFNDVGGRNAASSELGATAAAILAERAGRKPADWGLEAVASFVPQRILPSQLGAFYHRLLGYRFTSPDGRERFRAWWSERRRLAERRPTTMLPLLSPEQP